MELKMSDLQRIVAQRRGLANLPKMLMQHSDLPFPSETQLFPMHGEILEYLERYARDVWTYT